MFAKGLFNDRWDVVGSRAERQNVDFESGQPKKQVFP
jgi:hypothetical protein